MSDIYSLLQATNHLKSTHHCGPGTVSMDGGVMYALGQIRNGIAHNGEVGSTFTPGQMQSLVRAGQTLLPQVTSSTLRHK